MADDFFHIVLKNMKKEGKIMFFNVLNAKNEINLDGKEYNKETLLESENSSVNLIVIKKDGIIDTHTSKQDAMVYLIEGEIELHFDAEKFELKEKDFLMFKKDKEHKVLAKKDSKFLLIKI